MNHLWVNNQSCSPGMRRRGGTQKLRQLPRWAADGGEEREHTEKKSITKLFWSCQVFFFTRCCYLQFTDRRLMIRDNWGRGSTNNSQIKPQLVVIFINNRILKYKELCSFIDFFFVLFSAESKKQICLSGWLLFAKVSVCHVKKQD